MPQSALITKATSELCSNWIRFYSRYFWLFDSLWFTVYLSRSEKWAQCFIGWRKCLEFTKLSVAYYTDSTSAAHFQCSNPRWLLHLTSGGMYLRSNRDFHRGRQRKNVWLKLTLALRNVRLFTSVVSDSWFLLSGVSQWAAGEWQRLRKWLIQTVRSKQLAPANTQQLPHYSVAWVKGIRPMNPPAANRKHSC